MLTRPLSSVEKKENGKCVEVELRSFCSRLPRLEFFLQICEKNSANRKKDKCEIKHSTCAIILCSTQYWRCLPVMLDCSITVYILHRLLLRQ